METTPTTPSVEIVDPGVIQRPQGAYLKAPTHGKRGKDKVKRVRAGEQPTEAEILHVAKLGATGETVAGISRATKMSSRLVEKILAQPDVKAYVVQCRDAFRSIAMDGLVQVQADAMDWMGKVAKEQKEPKTFDALARGMANLERMASSASGENKPQINLNTQINVADVDMELDQLKKFLEMV